MMRQLELIKGKKMYIDYDHLMECRVCKEVKLRRFTGMDHRKRAVWRDKDINNKWSGQMCPKCAEIDRSRRKGHKAIDDLTEGSAFEGRQCEVKAKKYFESLGFKCVLTKCHGPDITLFLGDKLFATCEVKKVTIDSIQRHYIAVVREKRKFDDLICYVFKDGFYVTSMKSHLSKCAKSGRRCITADSKNKRGIHYNE